jgi:chromosome segregation ATPase
MAGGQSTANSAVAMQTPQHSDHTHMGEIRSVQVNASHQPSPLPQKSIQRDGITLADVERAVRKLTEDGVPVSLRSVRAELGTGSLSTVQRHLSLVRRSHELGSAEEELSLSPTVTRALAADIERAVKDRSSRLEADVQAAQTSIELLVQENEALRLSAQEAQATLEAAQTSATESSFANDALRNQVASLDEQLAIARSDAESARQGVAVAQERWHASEKVAIQLEAEQRLLRQELSELRLELAKAQKDAETARCAAAALQSQLAAKQQIEDYLRATADRAQEGQRELEEARQRLAALEAERTMLAERLEETKDTLHRSELNVQQFMAKVLSTDSRSATPAGRKA